MSDFISVSVPDVENGVCRSASMEVLNRMPRDQPDLRAFLMRKLMTSAARILDH